MPALMYSTVLTTWPCSTFCTITGILSPISILPALPSTVNVCCLEISFALPSSAKAEILLSKSRLTVASCDRVLYPNTSLLTVQSMPSLFEASLESSYKLASKNTWASSRSRSSIMSTICSCSLIFAVTISDEVLVSIEILAVVTSPSAALRSAGVA
ncbi:MAG: hypothetical protein BWY00_01654 [Firmicutes bacterium ADurb.Bin153]|nr:MAG: hypothetical protein BWY00_01654 [Firmicutes bacterium ADurb.Bin153]